MADLIIGRNACLEAIKGGRRIHSIAIQMPGKKRGGSAGPQKDHHRSGESPETTGPLKKIISEAEMRGIRIEYVDKEALDRMAAGSLHQGVIAKAEDYQYSSIDEIVAFAEEKGEAPFLIMLDGVEDPHNLGAIIRTAECAGAHGVVIPKNRSAQVNETVLRTSAGAAEHIRCARITNLNRVIEDLQKQGVWVFACDMGDSQVWDTDMSGPVALVIGGEGKGVSRLVKEHCDGVISLPMFGSVNSLNASNAAAISMYEVVRQRIKR